MKKKLPYKESKGLYSILGRENSMFKSTEVYIHIISSLTFIQIDKTMFQDI